MITITASPVNQSRSEEALSPLSSNSERDVCSRVVLGGMTKNVYHDIFQNCNGFTVCGYICIFFHA